MKKMMILLFILAALLSASCSQGPKGSAKFTFKLSYAVTDSTIAPSKFKVFAEKAGEKKEFDVIGSEAIITLPVGIWNFYSVEWNGSTPYTGALRCGFVPSIELKSGTEATIDFAQTEAKCGDVFFKAYFNNYCYEAPASTGVGAGLFRSGDGTTAAPYEICSVDQLNNIGANFSLTGISSANYKLARDINFHAKFVDVPEPLEFKMIGDQSNSLINSFTGSFDGRGFSIKGMTISASSTVSGYNGFGFFRQIGTGASISNINFYVPEIEMECSSGSCSGFSSMGTLAGQASGGTINNIHVFYGRVRGGNSVGGLIGSVNGGITISNATFENSEANGVGAVGGIIGNGSTTTGKTIQLTKVLASGDIGYQCEGSCSSDNFGGLIGYLSSGSDAATIQESTSSMNIRGMGRVGGLVGQNMLNLSIIDSYATGAVYSIGGMSGTMYSYAGGLIGDNGGTLNLTRAFFTMGKALGQSTSPQASSGILGAGTSPSSCTDVFTTSATDSAVSLPSGCSLVNYSTIRSSSTFNSWLSPTPSVWVMSDPGFDYPRLAWEKSRPCEGSISNTFGPTQDGSASNPYKICTKEQFDKIPNYPGKNFILLRDIDLSGQITSSYFQNPFAGTLDGNYKQLIGLDIYAMTSTTTVGLFKEIASSGVVKNLAITMPKVAGNGPISQVGTVAGVNNGYIANIWVNMMSVSGESNIGGITGINNGSILYSRTQGNVNATLTRLGGIAGENSGIINRSQSDTMSLTLVAGNSQFGGLVGYNYPNGIISESGTYISITSIPVGVITDIGGLVGYNAGTIKNSFAKGSFNNIADLVSSDLMNVGGFVGFDIGIISNSYSSVTISGAYTNTNAAIGPFVGGATVGNYPSSLTIGTPSFGNSNISVVQNFDMGSSPGMSGDVNIYITANRSWTITTDKDVAEDDPYSIWVLRDYYPEPAHGPHQFDMRDLAFYKAILGF